MSRISLAFRSFFSILFGSGLPEDIAAAFGFKKAPKEPPKPAAPPPPQFTPADGAVQMLAILQRDSRLIDFLMEDIAAYSDEQVGSAVRSLHDSSRQSLERYCKLIPVIDGVEGTYAAVDSKANASTVKLLGNVPAEGKVKGGTLRHRGWRVEKLDLPSLPAKQDTRIVAPAEIEIE